MAGGQKAGRLVLETVIHTILFPGAVTVALPWWILVSGARHLSPWSLARSIGILPIALGAAILAWCSWDFIVSGRGTPNPLDPPRMLVSRGAYRYVRNPMYAGIALILLGEAILFGAPMLLAYAAIVTTAFHLFVVLYEEPFLRARFGASYEEFCRRVPRWIPRTQLTRGSRTVS
ncbi:MAG TPA: isoprenylcysteine carboxylmethyltransferase family protein [Candidatus Binataceae bacterium]|nr:isoprenylcysteine carboxylmethyltransferase family protein [Candidatus Binataceae bacterium]